MRKLKGKKIKYIFTDQLKINTVIKVLFLTPSIDRILHFEPLSPFSQRLLRILRTVGIIHFRIERVNYHIGQVRNDSGESEYINLNMDVRRICNDIRRNYLCTHPLLAAMKSTWSTAKVLIFFDKIIERQMRFRCMQVMLTEWILKRHLHTTTTDGCLLIEKRKWFKYIKKYGEDRNIRVIAYRWSIFYSVLKF